MRKLITFVGSTLVLIGLWTGLAVAADDARVMQEKRAAEMVDTSAYKKEGPLKIGVAAGYMGNSWVVFTLQHIRYEASLHDEITEVLVTDAAFNPTKQVADIEDLISKGVDLILYWPVDDKAIEGALKKAKDKGIPTINTGGGFVDSPSVTASVFIDQWNLGEMVARRLFQDMGGKGKIFAMLPIAGTTAAVDQLAALEAVMKEYPGIELLSAEYGDWNRAKAKQITENLLQKYPEIDGVFSPAGQMSIGVAEAFDEAGRLGEVVMSPGDEYNGWLKWVRDHNQGGAVTFPTRAGQEALRLGMRILRGESVRKGMKVPSEYISPGAAGAYAEADRPDDWWASELPEEWKPK
ncbi:substrate-binding domain-containing protein [Sneathiella sp. HT1-7]|uniref:substrate-binding domain-containing protein n=1 Tax=Sneathiella sp. HT1-7 TaxID=2887192 RepID=UPI001D135C92|nr:substrate-binding domain-containing protein [Sneathiella sp. HT1-7]MCC3305215.1 substrate-binding domain-containing protein [Sneathiella sp. HT1-7]